MQTDVTGNGERIDVRFYFLATSVRNSSTIENMLHAYTDELHRLCCGLNKHINDLNFSIDSQNEAQPPLTAGWLEVWSCDTYGKDLFHFICLRF